MRNIRNINKPQYKIHGAERKKLKKELSLLRITVNRFWYYHTLDKDMAGCYGSTDGYPMSDESAEKKYNELCAELKSLENKLSKPYK